TGREPRMMRIRAYHPPRRQPREKPDPEPAAEPERRSQSEDSELASDIMSNSGEGIIVFDREMRCQVWNRFMEHLTGLRTEQVLGKRAVDFFPVLGEQPIEDILTRVLSGETVAIAETGYVVPGTDKQGWISASYRPQFSSKGHVTGAIGRVLELSERK